MLTVFITDARLRPIQYLPLHKISQKVLMSTRRNFAIISLVVLTGIPVGHQYILRNRPLADYNALVKQLDQVSLVPEGWSGADSVFEFDDQWRGRLNLKHHYSMQTTSPKGDRINILLMLSGNGEQLYHTPEICYAAHGCRVEGRPIGKLLTQPDLGDFRVVEVKFPGFGEVSSGVAAYSYWAGGRWSSPTRSNITNTLGREPFLLKLVLMLENQSLEGEETSQVLDFYLTFLGKQLQEFD